MNVLKRTVIAALLLGGVAACGTAEESAANYLESGKSLLADGKPQKARLEFKNAIQIDPRMAEPFYQLALIDEKDQKWKSMFANLNTVEQLDPIHYDAIVKLGQVHLLAGNLELALEKANKVITAEVKNGSALVLRASVNMKQDNYGSAMADVEQALALDANNIEAISVQALVLNKQGNTEQALSVLATALKAKPDELPLSMIKLSILEQQKDYGMMEQVYRELQGQHADAAWVSVALAKLLNLQDRYVDAKQVLQQFVETHPDDKQTKLLLIALIKTQEPEQAIALLDTYIEQEPENFELRFAKVQLQLAGDNTDAALVELKEIVALDPEGNSGRKAQVTLAGFELQQGEIESAQTKLTQVLAAAPEDGGALLLQARVDLIKKDVDSAVTNLRVVLRNNPESDQAMVLLAQAYMNSGSAELAEDNFRQALAVNPGNTIAALSVANSLMRTNDLDRTEEVLTKALQLAANKEPLLQALAQVKLLQKDWQGTESVVDTLRVDKQDTALTHFLSGRIAQGQERYDAAIEAYKAALALQPNMPRALQGLTLSYLQLGQKQDLLDYLMVFLESNPKQLSIYALLSNVYAQDKSWDQAVAVLEKGLATEPKWQAGYSALASVYFAQNLPKQAISSYQRGIEENPDSTVLSLQLASAFEQSAEFEQAKMVYEQVLQNNPDVEPAINNLASLLTDQFQSEANLKKAAEIADRFKSATEPYYLDTYAWVNVQLGNFDKAQPVLERVVSLSPNVAVFNYHLGALYNKQGNNIEAEQYLTTAKRLANEQGDAVTGTKAAELLSKL
ncbi:hypothetical protein A9Q79_03885 [Methylophaga sp. 42_25_T18]|nr:hypothetical protein A9Q79_03885 [Methylophaga sp. 42_25_T18]